MFICKECKRDTERESYGPRPLYCERCRPSVARTKAGKKTKNKPRPVQVRTATHQEERRADTG